MAKNIRKFQTREEYEQAQLVLPAVSLIASGMSVAYDPYVEPEPEPEPEPPTPTGETVLLFTVTYSDNTTQEISGEGTVISQDVVSSIPKSEIVSVEIASGVTEIGHDAFRSCTGLTAVTIPDTVTVIGNNAFKQCNLITLILPEITSMGRTICERNNNLSYIWISGGVVGQQSFQRLSGLTTVNIGGGVTSIGAAAFDGCSALTSVTLFLPTPPTVEQNSFRNTNDCPLYTFAEAVETYKNDENWMVYTERIRAIPSS